MMFQTLRFIWGHPLCRARRWQALREWLFWQTGSRLLPGAAVVPFVDDAVLLVEPGMTGATGNVYVGLAEFEEMAFLLHFLRNGDWFVDVGANIGAYTVLASACAGARSISIEALPATFGKLMRNVAINGIADRVEAHNCALGARPGELSFSAGLDTMNHVVMDGSGDVVVPVRTLDELCGERIPALIKVDVEGYETEVVRGGGRILSDPDQLAVIMELNGLGSRYGFDDKSLHERMLDYGYCSVSYDPFGRELIEVSPCWKGNVIYVRCMCWEDIRDRLHGSPVHSVKSIRL